MYRVEGFHHRKAYIKGDLGAEDVKECYNLYPTRKEANKLLIEKKQEFINRGYHHVKLKLVKRGDGGSELSAYTDDTWTHENTGEKHVEYYWYRVIKEK